MTRPTRLWFVERAREWLVRAQGHARDVTEESLADELEKIWELGVANSIEALDEMNTLPDPDEDEGARIDDLTDALRMLSARPRDPKRGS